MSNDGSTFNFHGNVENVQQIGTNYGPNVQNGHIDMGSSQQTYTIGQAMSELRAAATEQLQEDDPELCSFLQKRIDQLEQAAEDNDTDRVKKLFSTIAGTITTAKTIATACAPLAVMLGTLLA